MKPTKLKVEERLAHELRSLREDVELIKKSVCKQSEVAQESSPNSMEVVLEKKLGERKPYYLQISGSSRPTHLSAVRASICLVLFLDLADRLDGGSGVVDRQAKMLKCYQKLEENCAGDGENAVRLALYRIEDFFSRSKILRSFPFQVTFKSDECRLEVRKSTASSDSRGLRLTSSFDEINELIDDVLSTSPLVRVRKAKALFLPSGVSSHDRFHLELFDHNGTVKQVSMFMRPSLQSYPQRMLDQLKLSAARKRQIELNHEGLQSGKVTFIEIMNRNTLENLGRTINGKDFLLYPNGIDVKLVIDHISFMIHQLQTIRTYQLMLTDSFFPSIVASYEITYPDGKDKLAVFFRQVDRKHLFQLGSFVISDPSVYDCLLEKVFPIVTSHPSTIGDRRAVVAELTRVRDRLADKGPSLVSPADFQFVSL